MQVKTYIPLSQRRPEPKQKVDIAIKHKGSIKILYDYLYRDDFFGFQKILHLDKDNESVPIGEYFYCITTNDITHWTPICE